VPVSGILTEKMNLQSLEEPCPCQLIPVVHGDRLAGRENHKEAGVFVVRESRGGQEEMSVDAGHPVVSRDGPVPRAKAVPLAADSLLTTGHTRQENALWTWTPK